LAAGAVAAAAAGALLLTGGKKKDEPSAHGGSSPSAESEVPIPSDPREVIASAKTDRAPLTPETFFPDAKPGTFERVALDTTDVCGTVTQNGLGPMLTTGGCRKLLRATYVRDGVAVTVGVAVFDTKAAADKAKAQAKGNVAALPAPGAKPFCQGPACQTSANAEGRYAYFTVAGYANGSAVKAGDAKVLGAARDAADYTFKRIVARGEAAAGKSAGSASPSAS
ncbi:hypothetical protein AB0K09_05340, partial [Streptomyces sp. NPDC049577]|uniref:hypothetical protein n=1 Tax=Streptomyces sp. NPDC049577 TaxID=3155153 RepID=UPI00343FAFC6